MSTFREYLVESGFTFEQYAEEVRDALVKLGDRYKNADLYFYEELEEAYNNNAEVNATAADIASKFDEAFTLKNEEDDGLTPENGYEDFEKEYGKTLPELVDDNENYEEPDITEATKDDNLTDGETFDEWKLNAFKYIDKRVDINKVKDLGNYIKTFLKQEYDNGEPSWFMAAESVVNYVRMNYNGCLKDRSFATNITENAVEAPKVWVVIFNNEDEAIEQEYEFCKEGGWDSMLDVTLKGNVLYITDSKLAKKVVTEWFGDKAELVDITDTDLIS